MTGFPGLTRSLSATGQTRFVRDETLLSSFREYVHSGDTEDDGWSVAFSRLMTGADAARQLPVGGSSEGVIASAP
jgi:hypothetical protein